ICAVFSSRQACGTATGPHPHTRTHGRSDPARRALARAGLRVADARVPCENASRANLGMAMDFELPEELRLLKDNVRRFVDKELIPLERETVNNVALQKELPKKLRDKTEALGLYNYDVPEEFGGLGLGMLAKVIVWSEVSRSTALPSRASELFGPAVSP